jgi:hypothetical protein
MSLTPSSVAANLKRWIAGLSVGAVGPDQPVVTLNRQRAAERNISWGAHHV